MAIKQGSNAITFEQNVFSKIRKLKPCNRDLEAVGEGFGQRRPTLELAEQEHTQTHRQTKYCM